MYEDVILLYQSTSASHVTFSSLLTLAGTIFLGSVFHHRRSPDESVICRINHKYLYSSVVRKGYSMLDHSIDITIKVDANISIKLLLTC